MKINSLKKLIILSVLLCDNKIFGLPEAEKPNKLSIAVMDLEAKDAKPSEASIVSDFLRQEFLNTNKWIVLERSSMDKILKEQAFQMTGCTTNECAIEAGKILNVTKMVVGSLSRLEKKYYLSIRFVDVETSAVERAENGETDSLDKIAELCRQLAISISGKEYERSLYEKTGKDISEMVYVTAGEFIMGSDNGDYDEKPVHKAYLDAYYIDKYEVTNARYQKFIEGGGYNKQEYWTPEGWAWRAMNKITEPKWWYSGKYNSGSNYPNYPVVGVSWYEACAFAKWAGKRLPTEAEWEKAARGTDGRKYPWGDSKPDHTKANFNFTGIYPVDSHGSGQSPYSCYNMAGNVAEWCNDWFQKDYYFYNNTQGPNIGTKKVFRDRIYSERDTINSYYQLRSSKRFNADPEYRNKYLGFRCAR